MATIQLLLVDDEERFLTTTKILLEKRGIHIFSATNGFDAIKFMDAHRIDIVILDVKMPGMDGVAVLREIKKKYPLVEVIMLTGHATIESAIEGLKLGAFEYITKPFDMLDLVEKINAAYAKKQAMEEKIRKAKIEKIIRHPMAVFDKNEERDL